MSSSLAQLQAALAVAETTVSALRAQIAAAEAAQIAPITEAAEAPPAKKEAPTPWRKSTILLASEEEVNSATRSIDERTLVSPTPTVSWHEGTKHHPRAEMPARIIALLTRAPERRLSFQALIVELKLGMNLKDTLQNYLRELQKQKIISVA
jgi:hypothetical protein